MEYMVLDKMLFQSNLTNANNGEGYQFHVRQLARELNIARSYLSDTLKRWTFIHKQGSTKAMVITLDYDEFMEWIEGLLYQYNNDCLTSKTMIVRPGVKDCPPGRTMIVRPGEPISNREESTTKSKKKEGTSTSTGKIIESSTGQPSMAVAPSSTQEDLAELFESQFNGCPALQSKVPSDCQFAACGGWQVPPSVQSAPEGKENISTGVVPASSRELLTCPVPLYGK
jgi:hypothetical protein